MTNDLADALNPDVVIECESCHRLLHEPASRALGLGPVCRKGHRDLARRPGAGQLAAFDLDPADTTQETP